MSRIRYIELTLDHCKQALSTEIIIGSYASVDRHQYKRFVFHVFDNEYRVYSGKEIVASGKNVEELLNIYNNL